MRVRRGLVVIAILSLLVIILGVSFLKYNGFKSKINKQLDLGRKYLEELDFEEAKLAFEAILQIDPHNSEAIQGYSEAVIEIADIVMSESGVENALSFLREEYDFCPSPLIEKKIKEFEDIISGELAQGDVENSIENEKKTIRPFTIDGIIHGTADMVYYEYDFDDRANDLLDQMIMLLATENYDQLEILLTSSDFDHVYNYNETGNYISEISIFHRILTLHGDYKIEININIPSEGDLSNGVNAQILVAVVPIGSGLGYYYNLFYSHSPDYPTYDYYWAVGQCNNGTFNGEATIHELSTVKEEYWRNRDGNSIYLIEKKETSKGNLINALRDGIWEKDYDATYSNGDRDSALINEYYNNGKYDFIKIEQSDYGIVQYYYGEVINEESTSPYRRDAENIIWTVGDSEEQINYGLLSIYGGMLDSNTVLY